MTTASGDRSFTLTLSIDRAEFERLYRGQASTVLAYDAHGRSVRFPARALQPFVGHNGVQGTFVLTVDAANRLRDIRRRER